MIRTFVAVIILLSFSTAVVGQKVDSQAAAVVNDESISADEVRNAAEPDFRSLEHRRIQFEIQMERDTKTAMENALDKIITERVLAAEAAEHKVSVDELVAIEVDGALPDERQQAYEKFVDSLRKKYGARSLLEPQRTVIATAGRPSRGSFDAPVTLVEFADFECPFCGGLSATLKQIEEDYKDRVRFVYLQFPLADLHPDAVKAAEASLCAYEQGKFWELHDAMFSDQRNLTVDDLKRKASMLSLDEGAFVACLDGGKYFPEIRADVDEGIKAGVEGTPAMFINGRFLIGNLPYTEIQKIIDEELVRNRRE